MPGPVPETTATGGKNGLTWLTNPFGVGSGAKLILTMQASLAAATTGFAQEVENYAKENAPWDDRTGDARDGLTARGEQRLTKYTIYLFHTVDYGIWLEVRWDGKYAIILPTILHMGHELMGRLDMAMLATGAVGRL